MTVYELNEIHNKEIAEPCTMSEDGFWHNVRKYLREYAEVTGIHGFRYVAEKRSAAEKWVTVYVNNFYVNYRAFKDYLEFGFDIFIRWLCVYDFRNSG